jgi:tRNA (guanine-N7-)-methyltransferase
METQKHLRTVRSFVRREGRMSPTQRRALEELMPRFGLVPTDAVFDLESMSSGNWFWQRR